MTSIDATSEISSEARIGPGCVVWGLVQIREGAVIGAECILGRGVYVDTGVVVGRRCKIQNFAMLYAPARIGDGVFVGPGALLTNDAYPRAVTPDGARKTTEDWEPRGVRIDDGGSIGAGAIVLGGVRVGPWALVAAGSVVTADVPGFALVRGAPARRVAWVGRAGVPLQSRADGLLVCTATDEVYRERDGDLDGPL